MMARGAGNSSPTGLYFEYVKPHSWAGGADDRLERHGGSVTHLETNFLMNRTKYERPQKTNPHKLTIVQHVPVSDNDPTGIAV